MALGAGTASAVAIRSQVEAFGSDGTAASSFGNVGRLAFNQATSELYAGDGSVPGVYGFDVSAPPAHPPLSGFSPLTPFTTAFGSPPVAVDNTALASAGNVYVPGTSTGLVYGFDSSGAPLGGNFPIDPALTPGAPAGSPKVFGGADVDSDGNLWVANYYTQNILEYNSAGVYQGTVSTAAQGFYPGAVSFDSKDDMYVTDGTGSHAVTYKYTAASAYSTATLFDAHSTLANAVDRLTDHVFLRDKSESAVNELDSAGNQVGTISEKDASGATIIPTSSGIAGARFFGITVDSANDRLYLSDERTRKIRVFGAALTYPDLSLGTASALANTTATVAGTLSAQGLALSECRFEYVSEAAFGQSGFTDLSSGGSAPCSPAAGSIPADSSTNPVSGALTGLTRNTTYRVRLLAANANGSIATLSDDFETAGPPLVETTGSPTRTATSARLDSRVSPSRAATTYHFEYGTQGPCDANPCIATESHAAGSGNEFVLVSQQLEGLEPNTTYHYRVIADNGNPDGAAVGADMTLTTFADDAPLSHGHLPGPPGSDRAWEQVSAPDTGGNPVGGIFTPNGAASISDAGDRAVYAVSGGTPISETGTWGTRIYAERTPSGWQSKGIYAPREEADGAEWLNPGGPSDLSAMVAENYPGGGVGEFSIWKLRPDAPPAKLYGAPDAEATRGAFLATSDDGSRVLATLLGTQDPGYPTGAGIQHLYDIGSGPPRLIDLLPDGSAAPCGTEMPRGGNRAAHWVSPDGSLAFFPTRGSPGSGGCTGTQRLYVRDIPAETTKPISGAGNSIFIKSVPGAAFFYSNGDVYRYDLADDSLDCVTCVAPGLEAAVIIGSNAESIGEQIGVSEDGSRVYFTSLNRLLPGAADTRGTYRVDTQTGELAYVGKIGAGGIGGGSPQSTISADGSVAVFRSQSLSLNALGGPQNGGGPQYYRYDDKNRSLLCLSCPPDGSAPRGEVGPVGYGGGPGANTESVSRDGQTLAFATPTALVAADQNTAGSGQKPGVGTDVYEWRDGRLLLISDGLTNWPEGYAPSVAGITPDGHDIFFLEAAQLTPDALDGYRRLYDARIGGGFEFPQPPPPCSLEVCQGTPKGAPEEAPAGTGAFSGPGNAAPQPRISRCPKGKRKVRRAGRSRCVKPRQHKRSRANHNRRTKSPTVARTLSGRLSAAF